MYPRWPVRDAAAAPAAWLLVAQLLVLLAVPGTAAALQTEPPGLDDAPPPTVERVTPTSDALEILPAVTDARPDADGTVVVVHRIVNGTDTETLVRLEVQGIDRATSRPDPEATIDADVQLVVDEVQLAPSEAATVASVARGVGAGLAYAVVASVPRADPPVEIASVVLAAEAAAEVGIDVATLTPDRLEVTLDVSQGPVLVDAAVRLTNWAGREIVHAEEPGLIAWGDGDPVELGFSLKRIVLPGPYRVEVIAAAGAGEARHDATVWLFPEPAMITLAGVLIALTATGVAVVLVRRRRGRAASSAAAPPSLEQDEEENHDG